MPFYILDKSNPEKNKISQYFGYALVHYFKKQKKQLTLISETPFKITDSAVIFKKMESSLIFGSHYIEESLYYKSYEASNWDENVGKSFLQDAYMVGSKKYYNLGLTLGKEEKQPLFIEEEIISVFLKENDDFVEYPMAEHKLLGYFDDNNNYIYIQVAFSHASDDEVSGVPMLPKEDQDLEHKVTDVRFALTTMYERIIKDSLALNILNRI